MTGFSLPQAIRVLVLVVPFVACLLMGCAETQLDRYPDNIEYGARTDLLVLALPKDTPFYPDTPGQLSQNVARLTDLGGKTFDPKTVPAKHREALQKKLETIFGTPRFPRVFSVKDPQASAEVNQNKEALGLGFQNLRKGSALYRRHCLHCHGVPGDGHGPTGPWVNPHPRDYRQGSFKFISTSNSLPSRKARRDDLVRTLQKGIEGTSMPAFGLLPDDEINALVGYVIHLSLRGEVEFTILRTFADGNPDPTFQHPDPNVSEDLDLSQYAEALTVDLLKRWTLAASTEPNSITAPTANTNEKNGVAKPESIVRGYKKFTEAAGDAACLSCHNDFGRQAYFRYDVWGTLARPANLTVPVYRGGRRPLDIYWRISGGIEGCGMPANKTLTPDQYWDLVNFVQALPYPKMLPDEIRDKVYVPEKTTTEHGSPSGH